MNLLTTKDIDKATITNFLTKMAEQDNRCTRAPYYYVIRTEETYPAPMDFADETEVVWNSETYDSIEALKEYLEGDAMSDEDIYNRLQEATEYGLGRRWVHKGMFLTESDAKDHLTSNHYHYSKNAHTFICYASRAPELEKFMKALFCFFQVDEGNYKL